MYSAQESYRTRRIFNNAGALYYIGKKMGIDVPDGSNFLSMPLRTIEKVNHDIVVAIIKQAFPDVEVEERDKYTVIKIDDENKSILESVRIVNENIDVIHVVPELFTCLTVLPVPICPTVDYLICEHESQCLVLINKHVLHLNIQWVRTLINMIADLRQQRDFIVANYNENFRPAAIEKIKDILSSMVLPEKDIRNTNIINMLYSMDGEYHEYLKGTEIDWESPADRIAATYINIAREKLLIQELLNLYLSTASSPSLDYITGKGCMPIIKFEPIHNDIMAFRRTIAYIDENSDYKEELIKCLSLQ